MSTLLEAIEFKIDLYRKIPIWPKQSMVKHKHNLSAVAPLCEDDDGRICFLTASGKKHWMNCLYAEKQRALKKT